MTHARLAHAMLAIALLFGATGCKEPPGNAHTGQSAGFVQPSHVRVVEYPLDGVDLGQGWHEEQAVKAAAICVDFKTLADTGQEQTMQMSVVTDRSDLMEQLEVSAEVQVKAIAYSVSGKARYAQAVEMKSESLNFVAHARVDNGVEYAAPVDVGGLKRIDLTPHYRDLARRDAAAFERECGDGFVSAIHAGAELTAVLSFVEQNTTKRKELEASMKGSGWGFSAKGKASAKMDEYAGRSALTISYHQTGGQGNPIPTKQEDFAQAIERLPALAAQDGVNYRIRVQSYRSLPGYPTVAEKSSSFRHELAVSYGRLASLRDDVVEILESLESPEIDSTTKKVATGDDYVDFRPDPVARMRALHDELTEKLREMTRFAAACSHLNDPPQKELGEQCSLPSALRETNDYPYRVRLPVLRTQTVKPVGVPTPAEIKDAIIEQYVRTVSRRRCARDVGDAGCLLESDIAALRASLDGQENQAPTEQAPTAPTRLR